MASSLKTLLKGRDIEALRAKLEPGAITSADTADSLATEAELVHQIEERISQLSDGASSDGP